MRQFTRPARTVPRARTKDEERKHLVKVLGSDVHVDAALHMRASSDWLVPMPGSAYRGRVSQSLYVDGVHGGESVHYANECHGEIEP